MATSKKTAKAEPAVKKETASADKSASTDTSKTADAPKTADTSKTEAADTGGAPKNYSRGEGQKVVTQAYRDNWNDIFGKKKKR
jgi:hypothetical protein